MKRLVKYLALLIIGLFPAFAAAQTHRTADKAWWGLNVASWASTVADVENTELVLRHGGRELNPLYGPHPSHLRMYAISAPLAGLSTWLSYRWKREDDADKIKYGYTARVRWYIAPVINLGAHGFGVGFTLMETGR